MFSILSIQDRHDIVRATNITFMSGKIDKD